ncbi:MAG: transposase family protein [Methyloglobulus sp.]|nr:transposase family protein [Methyloglobulus sp.]
MILNLPSITVTRIEEENNNDYHVCAVPNSEPQFCLECLGTAFYGHDTKTHLYMATPVHSRRVGVLLERKRYKCRGCGKTFSQNCSDINDNHRATNRLVECVENNALDRTFTSVADEIGGTEGTARKIVGSYIGRLEKKYQFESPEILGIDEVHLNRLCGWCSPNISENNILDLISNRKKQTVINSLYRFKALKKIGLHTSR